MKKKLFTIGVTLLASVMLSSAVFADEMSEGAVTMLPNSVTSITYVTEDDALESPVIHADETHVDGTLQGRNV